MDEVPPQPPAHSPNGAEGNSTPEPDRTSGMLCHLLALSGLIGVPFGNIVGPLIIWLIKKDQDPFVDRCGKNSLNFQITATLAMAILTAGGFICAIPMALIPFIGLLYLPFLVLLLFGLMIAVTVLTVIGGLHANDGKHYSYPYSIEFIK
ncbi:DUF4870 domain-containing protein [Coraliomargarita parva]|uniref:DUF4870 domain-containing protein n=1 Tax=Coraliomargarita parva TaxID=3014050 RepID=UPI0022B4A5D5|nr:DUF4870 domain-containing protein [Coraliomargarita parva]